MPWFVPTPFVTTSAATSSITNPWNQIIYQQSTAATTSSIYQPIYWTNTASDWTTDPQQAAMQQTYQAMQQQAMLQQYAAQQAAAMPRPAQRQAPPQVARVVEERRIAREEAQARSRALLLEHLTPKQRETFETNHWFVVEGGKSKRPYRINTRGSLVANVELLDSAGVRIVGLCAHCSPHEVPIYDQYLAQKVMLELAEDDFLRVANRHP